jgi:hypothetical protein
MRTHRFTTVGEMHMKSIVSFMIVMMILGGQMASAQQLSCGDIGFAEARSKVADVFATTTSDVENGHIAWESFDWDEIVYRVVFASETFLNYCAIVNQPLEEQPEILNLLAVQSMMQSPIESLDVGSDFGDITLSSRFTPTTELIDLNGDGTDELILHTQVPFFSEDTVYQIRGGLSIAFFFSMDGWQGQVIAPISYFVTETWQEVPTYTMTETHPLYAQTAPEALVYFSAPNVQVLDVEDTRLTFVTLYSATATGEAKELAVLIWEDRAPSVELRVAFDDWCYPGSSLDWQIGEDGSVFVPSNGGEEGSPLHCGRTPEVLFQWVGGEYVSQT